LIGCGRVVPTFVFGVSFDRFVYGSGLLADASASATRYSQYPKGQEKGEYLAVDLGGTNLRVCLVTLQGEGKFTVTQTKYRLTEEQKQEDGQKL